MHTFKKCTYDNMHHHMLKPALKNFIELFFFVLCVYKSHHMDAILSLPEPRNAHVILHPTICFGV